MYDDDAERGKIVALFERYNREKLSPAVDAGFRELAHERMRRHPLRTFFWLPLCRVYHLFAPVPEWELPMRSKLFGLPALRPAFGVWDLAVYALAIAGAWLLYRREKRLVIIMLMWIGARAALFSFAIPNATTERYLIECYPALLILAAFGLDAAIARLRARKPAASEAAA
jgi:hypothetical protein